MAKKTSEDPLLSQFILARGNTRLLSLLVEQTREKEYERERARDRFREEKRPLNARLNSRQCFAFQTALTPALALRKAAPSTNFSFALDIFILRTSTLLFFASFSIFPATITFFFCKFMSRSSGDDHEEKTFRVTHRKLPRSSSCQFSTCREQIDSKNWDIPWSLQRRRLDVNLPRKVETYSRRRWTQRLFVLIIRTAQTRLGEEKETASSPHRVLVSLRH